MFSASEPPQKATPPCAHYICVHFWPPTYRQLVTFAVSFAGDSHVLHSDILENLAVVDVPDGLVIPHFGGQQDGSQDDALPVGGADIQLRVGQESLQVHLGGGLKKKK